MDTTVVAAHPAEAPSIQAARRPIEHLAIICSKGTLDMAYPGLVLANAARMSGIDATLFFTFWGLDIVTKATAGRLRLATVGNPSLHLPALIGALPGVEALVTRLMQRQMAKLDLPAVPEMLEMLHDAGARLYACRLAMDMFKRTRADLVDQVDDVISAMDFFDRAAGAQVLVI